LAVVDQQSADIEANKSVAVHSAAALVDLAAGSRKSTGKGKGAKKTKKTVQKRAKKTDRDLIADFVKKIQKHSSAKQNNSKRK
jgi:hypothetical protein